VPPPRGAGAGLPQWSAAASPQHPYWGPSQHAPGGTDSDIQHCGAVYWHVTCLLHFVRSWLTRT
jgi:hypothetical protein